MKSKPDSGDGLAIHLGNAHLARTALDYNLGGTQGRRKTNWRRSTLAGLTKMGSSWVEVKATAHKRVRWRPMFPKGTNKKKKKNRRINRGAAEQQQTLKSEMFCSLLPSAVDYMAPVCCEIPKCALSPSPPLLNGSG